ncbi:MDR family MFS transporter [Paenibacillus piri]|uniref:DHA2 family efflux MFS transporter permease subunit n=1 Tax=Paenibacillus piri TaxID=2547395 RepID=A0A4R5KHE0_9BACL|nr:MDR family MFS transporter [Paenibacillus piri]TDF94813.1 DHA2 family efflux MFS transporter permease subunit [Paenibacillus piri]
MTGKTVDLIEPSDFRISKILAPLIAIIVGSFLVILDTTVMNVVLPTLVKDFKVGLSALEWTVTGYMLATAAVIPMAGWLSDRYGAKHIFLTSIFMFTLGSALCSTSNQVEWLIAFRVIQGLGGGFVIPVGLAYVFKLSPPEKVGMAMGLFGVPILLAPAIGPVISGWLAEFHSWRWIFLINIPVGLFSILYGMRSLPRIDKKPVSALDLPGLLLGPLAFVALMYGVNEGVRSWTSATTITSLVLGVVLLLAFILVELRSAQPLLELRVFQSFNFSLAMIVQWIVTFTIFGALFLVPQFLQQAGGFGAFDTGLTLLPQPIAAALTMPLGGYLFDRIGVRWLIVIGLGLLIAALWQFTYMDQLTSYQSLVLPLAMAGCGMGLMMMPLDTHILNQAPRELVSRVTSLAGATQQLVCSLTVATLVTVYSTRLTRLMAEATASSSNQEVFASQAFGFTFGIMVIVGLCGIVLGLFLRKGRKTANLPVF